MQMYVCVFAWRFKVRGDISAKKKMNLNSIVDGRIEIVL